MSTVSSFLKLGFTPCKVEKPLQGMELKKKKEEEKDEKYNVKKKDV